MTNTDYPADLDQQVADAVTAVGDAAEQVAEAYEALAVAAVTAAAEYRQSPAPMPEQYIEGARRQIRDARARHDAAEERLRDLGALRNRRDKVI